MQNIIFGFISPSILLSGPINTNGGADLAQRPWFRNPLLGPKNKINQQT